MHACHAGTYFELQVDAWKHTEGAIRSEQNIPDRVLFHTITRQTGHYSSIAYLWFRRLVLNSPPFTLLLPSIGFGDRVDGVVALRNVGNIKILVKPAHLVILDMVTAHHNVEPLGEYRFLADSIRAPFILQGKKKRTKAKDIENRTRVRGGGGGGGGIRSGLCGFRHT